MLQSHDLSYNTTSAGLVSENDGTGHSDSSADSDDSVLKRTAKARIAARRIGYVTQYSANNLLKTTLFRVKKNI